MSPGTSLVPFEAFVWIGSVLFALLVSVIVLTVGRSVWSARRDKRRAQLRAQLRPKVFTFLETDDSDPGWLDEIDTLERSVLRDLIKDQLAVVSGDIRGRLQRLGIAINLDEWAITLLKSEGRFARLRGLTWLHRLDIPVDTDLIVEHCRDSPTLRAAGARVLSTRQDQEATEAGTTLLYRSGRPLTVLGVDTLYQFHKDDPTQLIAFAERNSWLWDDALVTQTLAVIRECDPIGTDGSLKWVVEQTAHEDGDVRAAAVSALERYGWRPEIRYGVDWDQRLRDRSIRVRRSTYRVLGAWDDALADRLIDEAIVSEPDGRTRVIAAENHRNDTEVARAVEPQPTQPDTDPRSASDWSWVDTIKPIE